MIVGMMACVLLSPGGSVAAQARTVSAAPAIRIGALAEPPEYVFGQVEDAAVSQEGELIVLDFLSRELRVFDGDGLYRSSFGRAGNGPGEMDWPQSIEWLSPDTLLLLDAGNRRISVLHFGDGALTLTREISLPHLFHDLCVLDSRLLLTGAWEGNTVHELSLEGGYVASYGPLPVRQEETFVERQLRIAMSSGRSVCSSAGQSVVMLPRILPEVIVVSLLSGELTRVPIPNYRATQFIPISGGSVQYAPDSQTDTAHEGVGLGLFPDGHVLVQVQEMSWGEPLRGPETWALDSSSLELVWVADDLRPIISVSGDRMITRGDRLYPEVLLWRLDGRW